MINFLSFIGVLFVSICSCLNLQDHIDTVKVLNAENAAVAENASFPQKAAIVDKALIAENDVNDTKIEKNVQNFGYYYSQSERFNVFSRSELLSEDFIINFVQGASELQVTGIQYLNFTDTTHSVNVNLNYSNPVGFYYFSYPNYYINGSNVVSYIDSINVVRTIPYLHTFQGIDSLSYTYNLTFKYQSATQFQCSYVIMSPLVSNVPYNDYQSLTNPFANNQYFLISSSITGNYANDWYWIVEPSGIDSYLTNSYYDFKYNYLSDTENEQYILGKNEGIQEGYQDGYSTGLEQGYDNGYNIGRSNGYQTGYADGYNEGSEQDTTALAIFNGIVSIGLLPVNMFLQVFNFEVFGINIGALVSALLTIAIVIIIIRVITGKKE